MARRTQKQFLDENGIDLRIGEGMCLNREDWKFPEKGKSGKTEVRSQRLTVLRHRRGHRGWDGGVGKANRQLNGSESRLANIALCAAGQSKEVGPNSQRT